MSDPSRLIIQLTERSRRKLMDPKNLSKGSWMGMSDESIKNRILDEILELLQALKRNDSWEEIADEAADVYHFAGMGADPYRVPRLGSTPME